MSYELQPIYIAGPTASGKSDFAIRLARELDGIIISADSMQIYKGLDVGTAKVSKSQQAEIPHKLIDVVNYDEEFSVAQFAELARKEIDLAISQGKYPIVVGGTGLYFEALLYPMSFGNTVKNETLRAQLQAEYQAKGGDFLHRKLGELDAETAKRLHPNDVKRIIRALEIILTTGKTLKENGDVLREDPNVIMIAFDTDREKLYARINERVDIMFEQGLAEEALSIGRFDCQSMQAIGYKEFADCKYTLENGRYALSDGEEDRIKNAIKQHTRNYAKRQLTWFRRYKFIKWFECGDYGSAIQYIKSRLNR